MESDFNAKFAARLEHEKLAALKELAYGASHEINNPLANIAARAQSLLAGETDPERRRKLAAIHRQALRAHEMISDLMLFARPPKLTLARCDLPVLVARVIHELRCVAEERKIELLESFDDRTICAVVADGTQIGVAVKAMIVNAIEAVGANGCVEVSIRRGGDDDRQAFAQIVIRDDGPGISPHVRDHLFDPFFSGREAGRGLGFGLSKCWRIAAEHGGHVLVNDVANGAEIVLCLPEKSIRTAA